MRLLKSYGRVVAHHPLIVLLVMLLVTAYAVQAASNIKNAATSYRNMLPEETDIVRSMLIVGDQFGGISTALIVIESAPSEAGSNELRDMREPDKVCRHAFKKGLADP
jgi:predicted RND superfamily exporter protein